MVFIDAFSYDDQINLVSSITLIVEYCTVAAHMDYQKKKKIMRPLCGTAVLQSYYFSLDPLAYFFIFIFYDHFINMVN